MADVEVCVGRVGRPHGVRGDVAVELRTDEPERRFVVGALLTLEGAAAGAPRSVTVSGVRRHQGRLLVRFEELGDRTAAEVLRGATLHALVCAQDAPSDPDEFYDHQLVGLVAEDAAGRVVGEVSEVRHGAQDLLVIDARRSGGAAEVLVPFVEALVPEVDLAGARLVVADRPGLLDPTEATEAGRAEAGADES
ncbi:ribosome maturation factor RimM [Marmoricola endophyticus]|uniref:Ribosome maturation factor RimM n=1 Tax=Marmoricola endophyticus TaxID=2040280 RepID=A0A917BEF4_9ACTN|nr:ribosome maturation factor RimM [Marmoricola endophyticus]GGF38971.1 ribosome maturation factor RimM [Marmoricola endophyticus]